MAFLITKLDGSVVILTPGDKWTDDYIDRDILSIEGYVSHVEIDQADIPKDRTFRSAWTEDKTKAKRVITHNYDKCREIIRDKRNLKLEELDKKAYSAQRKNDTVEIVEIDAEAQRLRDIPQNADFEKSDVKKLKALYDSIA